MVALLALKPEIDRVPIFVLGPTQSRQSNVCCAFSIIVGGEKFNHLFLFCFVFFNHLFFTLEGL